MIHPRVKTYAMLPLLLLLSIPVYQQVETGPIDLSDVLVYKAPATAFKDIELQSHKGLPRFGTLNQYRPVPTSAGKPQQAFKKAVRPSPEIREKLKRLRAGYINYLGLVKMKHMKPLYDDMNRTQISAPVYQNTQEKDARSYLAQTQLRKLANTICTQEVYDAAYGGTNQFEQQRNYANFVAKHFDGLQQWSKDFMPNDALEAYHVSVLNVLRGYDFDKKGYWINLNAALYDPHARGSRMSFFSELVPQASFEEALLNMMSGSGKRHKSITVLLPMNASDAEVLSTSGQGRVFVVVKIRTFLQKVEFAGNNPIFSFGYHYKSPVLEVYKDEALTQKIGDISLERPILKE
ncbi:hypothetical protein [Spongiimicrobium sp. 2-473A-2-J]|uniref:hypothetical protein n=1 Tax=Eudoraea algarum TaxID=3417568 RepID=UPI003D36912B